MDWGEGGSWAGVRAWCVGTSPDQAGTAGFGHCSHGLLVITGRVDKLVFGERIFVGSEGTLSKCDFVC